MAETDADDDARTPDTPAETAAHNRERVEALIATMLTAIGQKAYETHATAEEVLSAALTMNRRLMETALAVPSLAFDPGYHARLKRGLRSALSDMMLRSLTAGDTRQ